MTTQIHDSHDDDDVMTAKHGATTDWMEANGESLRSIAEGDEVHVIGEFHVSTSVNTTYRVVDVPTMEYSFDHPAIQIVEVGTSGPRVTIGVGKVSKSADKMAQ